ncbi:DUF6542 domain-containing protein [Kitasatospora brasiliensis]|uniref:DUF6542 domain-containing protein n=1 Tax=Kitasatospora brasiliensis TaxID=3058040 RepID=UPI00292E5155|nr:DUF6542 domain-containing protein [Kitasatospora sp. K002]
MIGPYVGRVEQSIRTQPPGPRRRPPTGAAAAAVPGPGRAPETVGAPAKSVTSARPRPPAASPRLRLRLPLGGHGRGRTGRPTRLTAIGTGVLAVLATLAMAGVDRLLFDGLGWLFGFGYLVVCFQLAVRVRYVDLLAAPISGPIAFALALLLLEPVHSSGVTAQVVSLATGLALRADWLFTGTGLAALIVLARFVAQRRFHRAR